MTPIPQPRTVTVEIDGVTHTYTRRVAALQAAETERQ
jgi:hypothetical protein